MPKVPKMPKISARVPKVPNYLTKKPNRQPHPNRYYKVWVKVRVKPPVWLLVVGLGHIKTNERINHQLPDPTTKPAASP